MKIVEAGPGIIQIPPTGFGAIERVVWELYLALGKRGHSVMMNNTHPMGLDTIPRDWIIHCHWASHARHLASRGIPYAYTSHSHIWRQTCMEAISGAAVYLALHEGMVPDGHAGCVEIVGNGVSGKEWYNLGLEREKVVVSCANYSDRKRLEMTVELVDSLSDEWSGIIVGPGVIDGVKTKSSKVKLTDEMSARELRDLFNVCSVGFHPAREEAFALVPMEMAACGLYTFVSGDSYQYNWPIQRFETVSGARADIESYFIDVATSKFVRDSRKISDDTISSFSWDIVAERVERGLEKFNG
jgi:hypothetical protein